MPTVNRPLSPRPCVLRRDTAASVSSMIRRAVSRNSMPAGVGRACRRWCDRTKLSPSEAQVHGDAGSVLIAGRSTSPSPASGCDAAMRSPPISARAVLLSTEASIKAMSARLEPDQAKITPKLSRTSSDRRWRAASPPGAARSHGKSIASRGLRRRLDPAARRRTT